MRTLCVCVLAVSACFGAEWKHGTVELHNGSKQEGAVLDEPGQPLKVKMGAVVATFQRHEVKAVTFEEATEDSPFALMEKEYPDIAKDEGFRAVLRENVKEHPKLEARPAWELSMKVYALQIKIQMLESEIKYLKPLADKELERQRKLAAAKAKAEFEKAAIANPRLDPVGFIMRDPVRRAVFMGLSDLQMLRLRILLGQVENGAKFRISELATMDRETRLLIDTFCPYAVVQD